VNSCAASCCQRLEFKPFWDCGYAADSRVTELVAGSVAEALFLPSEPWPADSDRAQERALASLICTSPESIGAFIKFCMTEAAALLRPREHIVRALTAELLVRRTMNGDQVDTIISHCKNGIDNPPERLPSGPEGGAVTVRLDDGLSSPRAEAVFLSAALISEGEQY
jgi:hypothetical protein